MENRFVGFDGGSEASTHVLLREDGDDASCQQYAQTDNKPPAFAGIVG